MDSEIQTRLDVNRATWRRIAPHFDVAGMFAKVHGVGDVDTIYEMLKGVLTLDGPMPSAVPTAARHVAVCAICLDAPATHLLVPCGHKCGCQPCLDLVQQTSGECPICRTTIQSVQMVYSDDAEQPEPVPLPAQVEILNTEPGRRGFDDLMDAGAAAAAPRGTPAAVDEEWWDDDTGGETVHRDVTLSIGPVEAATTLDGLTTVAVRVNVPDVLDREPVDVCCVIDVSGSMGSYVMHFASCIWHCLIIGALLEIQDRGSLCFHLPPMQCYSL
jgi:hypothetical protein